MLNIILFIVIVILIFGAYQSINDKLEHYMSQQPVQLRPQPQQKVQAQLEAFDVIPLRSQPKVVTQHEPALKYCSINHCHEEMRCTKVGTCNYADPKKMSTIDLNLFLIKYPKDMTPQDYMNWLYAHNDPLELDYIDLQNYRKRDNLTWSDIQHIYNRNEPVYVSYHKINPGKLPEATAADTNILPGIAL